MTEQERPSKTRLKKQMHELQALGERLALLNADQREGIGLPDDLRAALEEAGRVPGRESRRRHMQYIGRLMRDVDPEPIREQLAAWDGVSDARTSMLHGVERWRDRLLDDDAALGELLRERPGADAQRLRALVRNARAEREAARPPRNYRELFRLLRDILQ